MTRVRTLQVGALSVLTLVVCSSPERDAAAFAADPEAAVRTVADCEAGARRSDCEAALARLAPNPRDAAESRARLRNENPEVRALDDRLLAAERAYHDACNGLAERMKLASREAESPAARP